LSDVVAGLDQLALRKGGAQTTRLEDTENRPRFPPRLALGYTLRRANRAALLVPAVDELALGQTKPTSPTGPLRRADRRTATETSAVTGVTERRSSCADMP
jgi:hypothetical protein